ncbi:hypothetical protein OSC27_07795 [Microbacterium sp. STN6]|uniref:hypothetical protein n=1 Tax=Microbacterium sp. STN6 TaxID=2995588 RepID=UPI002260AC21|nr:hypothetical protein [Microbacterium sp. STN6]MCX7522181.1 hypothetical protein [Microbacterium sp. STN6]
MTATEAKVTSVVLTYALGATAAVCVAVAAGAVAGAVTALLLLVASVVFFTRVFRGESEDAHAPRPWWRLSERPRAGFVLAALFAAEAIWLAFSLPSGTGDGASDSVSAEISAALRIAAVAVSALVALAFLNSSIRLMGRGLGLRAPEVLGDRHVGR